MTDTAKADHNPTEIEVTPEMIEAGVYELITFDSRFEDDESAVLRIYKAMESLKENHEQIFSR